jgi:hypothetical protein
MSKRGGFSGLYKSEPSYASFQVPTAVRMRYPLFWDLTQRRLIISYRRVGTSYLSHFKRSNTPDCYTLENGANGPSRNVCSEVIIYTFQHSRRTKILTLILYGLGDWEILQLQK